MASSRFLRLLKFFLPIALIILASAWLLTTDQYSLDDLPSPSWGKHEVESQDPIDIAARKDIFIQQATDWEIDGPWNPKPLHDLCASRNFTEGLHFQCARAYGGVGNVRNIVLTCVRYAIEAGATTILIPEITVRDPDLINLETGNNQPYTYMFDLDVFTTSLTTACPMIELVSRDVYFAKFPSVAQSTLTPKELGREFKITRVMDFAPIWREVFENWLRDYGTPKGLSISRTTPLLVSITASFFEFPIMFDSPDFIATFGRIVQFKSELRRLSAEVLYALNKKYKVGIEPAKLGVPSKKKFYGAHLRTDADAIAASFDSYDAQSTAYLAGAKKNRLYFIYLASGSKPDIERFTADAAKKKISVTTKYALLEDDEEFADTLRRMKELTWDQQALIDYNILLRSSHFGGTWASSFAWNIVMRRHVAVGKGTWEHSELAKEMKRDLSSSLEEEEEEEVEVEMGMGDLKRDIWRDLSARNLKLKPGECYRDGINTVYGPRGAGIWFELSMWP